MHAGSFGNQGKASQVIGESLGGQDHRRCDQCALFVWAKRMGGYLQLFLTGMHWEFLLDGPLPSKPPLLYVLNFNAHGKHLALAWTMSLDFELAIFHNCTFTQLDSFIHSFLLNF
jgi:hypothetical protein